ncbi:uncharacterized protein N0V89_002199 [Didymosphaeria variabile]|uniref:Cytochrome P450 n=1 Tax=Didymosphaeria variabile TaxID=1932322 RepID=A0A9W9CEG4_9PLEO|nr:uncharacterized protein N0V89_002199 [Didymosphaeria variabile]KAJ4357623.1 hypothetical protein N0V89_002199 [Didymosphaeria variabile]
MLHFADPEAYHDIYNNRNRWDKESRLYKSFNEDRSSFGFLTYAEAKNRKDVLGRSFSQTAIEGAEPLVVKQTKALCEAFERQTKAGKSSDLLYAFRCMSMDVITTFCFGKPIYAVDAPGFQAPIVMAMDASLPVFVGFKYSDLFKNMILKCPPKLSKVLSPATSGLVDLQQLLLHQIDDLTNDPEKLKALPHNMTIYHRLLDADAYRDKTTPSAGSLYEEAQALMFGGADTVGNTLMVGAYYLLQNPEKQQTLKKELLSIWPSLNGPEPRVRDLESLPYLNAVIKESLRLSSGVISGLLRVVPPTGARIAGIDVPPGVNLHNLTEYILTLMGSQTVVSIGSTFVHYNAAIHPEPDKFVPERWLESTHLDDWLVAFSRGPRMCLGINLAWAELRLGFAHVYRKFDLVPAHPL